MPNWCANRLIVTGTPDQLTALAEFSHCEGSDSFFSDVDVALVEFDGEIQLDFHTRAPGSPRRRKPKGEYTRKKS